MNAPRGVSALAIAVLVTGWALGSTSVAIAGIGLLLAALAARAWARIVRRATRLELDVVERLLFEGETLRVTATLRGAMLVPGTFSVTAPLGPGAERHVTLRPGRTTVVEVEEMPRGRYAIGAGTLLVEDPLGLVTVSIGTPPGPTVVVRPRIPVLEALFTDGGRRGSGGRRAFVQRPSGFEPHGVREYQDGEALRAVHWPATARRGVLMVRELDDAPRNDLAVVLDTAATGVVGPPGRTSLDEAVRAAGAVARAHAVRGRRVTLVLGGAAPATVRIEAFDRDWSWALDALAGVQPTEAIGLAHVLAASVELVGRGSELVLVTCRSAEDAGVSLRSLAAHGRRVGLVAIDGGSYAGRDPKRSSPGLLQLAASGIPVAIIRRGDDLVATLGGELGQRAAGA